MVLKNLTAMEIRAAMEKQTENRLMDMGRGEERVRCVETYTTICKIDSQWESAV